MPALSWCCRRSIHILSRSRGGESSTTQTSLESGPTTESSRSDTYRIVTEKCERALEFFRRGRVSREQTIIAFSKNLSDPALNLPAESIDTALASYLAHLTNIKKEAAGPGGATDESAVPRMRKELRAGERVD